MALLTSRPRRPVTATGGMDMFADKKNEFESKKKNLNAILADLYTRQHELHREKEAWGKGLNRAQEILCRGRNETHALSNNGKEAVKDLVAQANRHLEITKVLIAETDSEVKKVKEQVAKIDSIIARLQNANYMLELNSQLKNRSAMMEEAGIGIGTIEFDAIERDLRRLEYTTTALLELTGK